MTLTRRAAEHELDLALSLTGKLGQVWDKFRRGLIDMRRVKVFDNNLGHLSSADRSRIRDVCRPGCRMPAYDCDLDHRKAYSKGGPTHNNNIGPLCRHHHMAKHHAPWGLERLPNSDHSWTSPLSHTYTKPRAPPA